MSDITYKVNNQKIQLHGNGLFSKGEVTVSINKIRAGSGIIFSLNNQKIPADVKNISSTNRNTALTNGTETICLVEHFLAACSLFGVEDIEVTTNKNELIFNDGSALHWYQAFLEAGFSFDIVEKYELKNTIFINDDKRNQIVAIPHSGFKASYFMEWDHKALGKMWASWQKNDGAYKLLRARTFATKEENDFFNTSKSLLTLDKSGFNKELHEPLEPVYHKILDIVGDLRLSGVNPLEINMHVIGFKSGHKLNVEMAKELKQAI